MKLTALLFAPVFALAAGCNSAQLNIPPQIDSGSDLCDAATIFETCDASGAEAGTLCEEQPDAGITSGPYPLGCIARTYFFDPAGNFCAPLQCTCAQTDGSVGRWACAGE
jgi:hypothetical protein